MPLPAPRRQLLLFIAVLVLPCAFLIALGARMVTQDRELAAKRLADRRQLVAADLARAISDYLDQLTLDESMPLRAAARENQRLARRATVFVATLDSNGTLLPWNRPFARLARGKFTDQLALATRAEREGRTAEAEEGYRAALRSAADASQAAYAELQHARSLATRAPAASRSAYQHLLTLPLTVRDDEGVPFAFYAANALASDSSSALQVRGFVSRRMGEVMESRTISPVACYAFASITSASEARSRCVELEQAEAILRSPTWSATGPGDQGAADGKWIAVNNGRWLITRTTGSDPQALIAVRVDSLTEAFKPARAESPVLATSSDAEPLGRGLNGLGVIWPAADDAADSSKLTAAFYASALAIVLGVGLFAAYLLWRDVQRDIRLAQLRAQFVASVSHELKTPLTAIRIFAETLRDRTGIDAVTRAEYLDTIARDSDRLSRLLQNVLDFSRIERGERAYRLAPHDFPAVVERALQTVRHPLERHGFTLELTVDRNLPQVACDADAVEQAVLNLVSNAAKYAGDSRRIEVRVTCAADEVLLAVRDYGTGIAEQYQSHLFERFYRAPTAENAMIQGTGLGLTLVSHFAAGHGGRVTVQSAPDQGSTFTLHLPCPRDGVAAPAHVLQPARTGVTS